MKKIILNRRVLIKSILIFFFNKLIFSKNINSFPNKLIIIFGSCSNQNKDMKHWKEIITLSIALHWVVDLLVIGPICIALGWFLGVNFGHGH